MTLTSQQTRGPYYCGSGDGVAFGRVVSETHYEACCRAGLTIAGVNSEVMPGQMLLVVAETSPSTHRDPQIL